MATMAIAPATPSCAHQRGRTNASAATAPSPKTTARGRRNVETGKSNQSAPKAQAIPISVRRGRRFSLYFQRLPENNCFFAIDQLASNNQFGIPPIFRSKALLDGRVALWLFFRSAAAGLDPYPSISIQIWALRSRPEKQPTDLRRCHYYMRDGALAGLG
jgi:hypothetical protein